MSNTWLIYFILSYLLADALIKAGRRIPWCNLSAERNKIIGTLNTAFFYFQDFLNKNFKGDVKKNIILLQIFNYSFIIN